MTMQPNIPIKNRANAQDTQVSENLPDETSPRSCCRCQSMKNSASGRVTMAPRDSLASPALIAEIGPLPALSPINEAPAVRPARGAHNHRGAQKERTHQSARISSFFFSGGAGHTMRSRRRAAGGLCIKNAISSLIRAGMWRQLISD